MKTLNYKSHCGAYYDNQEWHAIARARTITNLKCKETCDILQTLLLQIIALVCGDFTPNQSIRPSYNYVHDILRLFDG